MPDEPLQNWTMPDSAYDTRRNLAYGSIKQTAIDFHSMLKSRAELKQRGSPTLELSHYDAALTEVIGILNRNNQSFGGVIRQLSGDLLLIVGGALITPLITEFLNWTRQPPGSPLMPTSMAVLTAIIGVLLVVLKYTISWR